MHIDDATFVFPEVPMTRHTPNDRYPLPGDRAFAAPKRSVRPEILGGGVDASGIAGDRLSGTVTIPM